MTRTTRKGEWLEIVIPEQWEGQTIEELFRHIWEAPKKQTHFMRMNKEVKINRSPANWTKPLAAGDLLELCIFKEEQHKFVPSYMELDIIYEDDHIIAVNKPYGMDTHPNSPGQANTLANGVAFYLQATGVSGRLTHINRLDRDTTGAVLFAKHSFIGSILDKMLQNRKIKRTYQAVVHGILKKSHGKIEFPIGRDRHHPTKRRVSATGSPAVTYYETIRKDIQKNITSLICRLETGRTHQIRVHLSALGHPLVGDKLYGGYGPLKRQALHASELEFIHPFTLEQVICTAEPPEDFKLLFFGE